MTIQIMTIQIMTIQRRGHHIGRARLGCAAAAVLVLRLPARLRLHHTRRTRCLRRRLLGLVEVARPTSLLVGEWNAVPLRARTKQRALGTELTVEDLARGAVRLVARPPQCRRPRLLEPMHGAHELRRRPLYGPLGRMQRPAWVRGAAASIGLRVANGDEAHADGSDVVQEGRDPHVVMVPETVVHLQGGLEVCSRAVPEERPERQGEEICALSNME